MKLNILLLALALAPCAYGAPLKIAWYELSRPWTLELVRHYMAAPNASPLTLGKPHALAPGQIEHSLYEGRDLPMEHLAERFSYAPLSAAQAATVEVRPIPSVPSAAVNPLGAAAKDFEVGNYLPWPLGTAEGFAPSPTAASLTWFQTQVESGEAPDIFVIAGHHVIGEGFHNSEETRFMFEPTLYQTVAELPAAQAYFDHVRLAILWGCNTLTDLEPHHADGSVMEQDEVRKLYESGPAGQAQVLGTGASINSMEFYKQRLFREYGPGTKEPAYVRTPKQELCKGPSKFEDCDTANLERILPNSGLYDGTRRYNEALKMNHLFRNAYLVLGFASVSPSEEIRVLMLQTAVREAQAAIGLHDENILHLIASETTPPDVRQRAIIAMRTSWEKTSYAMNTHHPSGSITPALPDIDQGTVMFLKQTAQPQLNARFR